MFKINIPILILIAVTVLTIGLFSASSASAAGARTKGTPVTTTDVCGGGPKHAADATKISINIGCKGLGNPIVDATFAIIRFLTNGVGLVIVGSMVYAGIQYSASRGDPQSIVMAQNRIRSNVVALLIFIFGYAILNYIIPAGFLK